ncbi:pyridoxamine 5'-phosphate oxidase family protein [Actinosynnema sp. NPDC050436]|uniref:pyridoxamine 5'-phosphate oxidase family protein n=1 Tax=Actinosynnema sp. NPDC050436 TaxID=3155659 RepID=UPI0033C5AE84
MLASRRIGVPATTEESGHPHLTTMFYDWDPGTRVLRFSTTLDRVKVGHVRRSGKAALHVSVDDWTFALAEGDASVSEATTTPGDAVGRELPAIVPTGFRAGLGLTDDEFLELQVRERRVVIRVAVTKLHGTRLDVD